ncbi:MAG: hypothetical protein ACRDHF_17005, partial [Tepidiformaceae bacterium]
HDAQVSRQHVPIVLGGGVVALAALLAIAVWMFRDDADGGGQVERPRTVLEDFTGSTEHPKTLAIVLSRSGLAELEMVAPDRFAEWQFGPVDFETEAIVTYVHGIMGEQPEFEAKFEVVRITELERKDKELVVRVEVSEDDDDDDDAQRFPVHAVAVPRLLVQDVNSVTVEAKEGSIPVAFMIVGG